MLAMWKRVRALLHTRFSNSCGRPGCSFGVLSALLRSRPLAEHTRVLGITDIKKEAFEL
jgi:hypothetical protein